MVQSKGGEVVRVLQMRMLPLVGLSMVPMMFNSDVLPPEPDNNVIIPINK
jgi:hypothetical protein